MPFFLLLVLLDLFLLLDALYVVGRGVRVQWGETGYEGSRYRLGARVLRVKGRQQIKAVRHWFQ